MTHELAGALQQAVWVRQRRAMKESHVYVFGEYIDVGERHISQTCNRTAIMQHFSNFVSAFTHHIKPSPRDRPQFTAMLFHPGIDRGIPP
ncbi:MAG: hypothetical protein JO356_13370 [Acidobacteria bacterium]|nr:hypothetical protein [Acidobacteriota bacterium]